MFVKGEYVTFCKSRQSCRLDYRNVESKTHQLRDPGDPLRRTSSRRCDIRVIWSYRLTGSVPAEEYFTSGERERDASVLRDGGTAVFADDGGV